MANVTSPILLDSTGQDIVEAIQGLSSGGSSDVIKISTGAESLIDGVSALPTGEIYLMVNGSE